MGSLESAMRSFRCAGGPVAVREVEDTERASRNRPTFTIPTGRTPRQVENELPPDKWPVLEQISAREQGLAAQHYIVNIHSAVVAAKAREGLHWPVLFKQMTTP